MLWPSFPSKITKYATINIPTNKLVEIIKVLNPGALTRLKVSSKLSEEGTIFWKSLLKGKRIMKLIIKISIKNASILFHIKAGPVKVFCLGSFSFIKTMRKFLVFKVF